MIPPTPIDAPTSHDPASCAAHPDRPGHATCSRCQRVACVACTHVLATGAVLCASCESERDGVIPWEQRRELGVVRALVRTVAGVITRPHAFFSQRTRERALAPTVALGLLLHLVAAASSTGWNLVFAEQTRAQMRADPVMRQLLWAASDEAFLAQLAVAPLLFFVSTFVAASFWWIALRAVGGLRRPYHVIVRALCYASATAALVPIVTPLTFVGPLGGAIGFAFGVWSTWIQIVAVSRMQGIEARRGALAFLLWLSLATMFACVLFTMLAATFASQIRIPNV
ncbi:YIP1 family protein [Sandaracinus amylolyticus]|uniref:Putative lipoprotein n=1 Tax=Sandaracinus amylolyticus TaxID=927083 RepID=A0A0F6W6D8_9BACT|nr:Yip1 family protein [Sandaracinus amylolyticus]AKF08477.1 putative lipoprotein [Sandaracinus amylolyticus]